MEVPTWTWWTRWIPNFSFCHRSAINRPRSCDLRVLSTVVLFSTWLCHKVRAKPAVAGRPQFTRAGSTDRASFTAPDLCRDRSVAAFLLPLILKGLLCRSQLFWPSPVSSIPPAHISSLNGYTCLRRGLRGVGGPACITQTNGFHFVPFKGGRSHKGDTFKLTSCSVWDNQTPVNKAKVILGRSGHSAAILAQPRNAKWRPDHCWNEWGRGQTHGLIWQRERNNRYTDDDDHDYQWK